MRKMPWLILMGLVAPALLFLNASLPASPAAAASLPDERVVRIAAVGDVLMGSEGRMPKDGGRGLFKFVAPYFQGYDIVFLNHEGTLTTHPTSVKNRSKAGFMLLKHRRNMRPIFRRPALPWLPWPTTTASTTVIRG